MSYLPLTERDGAIARIKELQQDEAMLLDDDLSDWWDFNQDGIELTGLREQIYGDRYERI